MHPFLQLAYAALWLWLSPSMVWHWLRGRPLPASRVGRALGLVPRRAAGRPCLWLQGEGLGELNVLLSLMPHFEQRHPGWDIVVTTATSSGFALAQDRLPRHQVLFCPFDLPRSIANVLDRIRPTAMVIVERAEHPRLIAAAKSRGIPLALINARILSREHRGHLPPRTVQQMVQCYDVVLAQTEEDAKLLAACGVQLDRLCVGGAVKFDNAQFDRQNLASVRLARLAGIGPQDVVFLAGSTRGREDEIAIRVFASLAAEFPQLKLVIVPRHARRFDEVCRHLQRYGVTFQRRRWLDDRSAGGRPADPAARALVVDVFGELPAWWGTAHIGFVGNSLTEHGGQNMIEPAAYGVATCFGPYTENFQDAVALLLRAGGAAVVASEEELRSFVRRCLIEPEFAERLGQRAQDAIANQCGAMERTIARLEPFFVRIARPADRKKHPLRQAS
jgi:3-deoxy-D-manno-octulosonic-acid transferase